MKRVISILVLLSLIINIAVINSCKKDTVVPTLTTTNASNITVSSLTSGGNITKTGGADVTARGVCYGASSNPLVSGIHTTDDSGIGSFVSNVTGLTPNTLYHIRAYATNSAGTAYGNEVTATTTAIVTPILSTANVTAISPTSAVSGGNITSDGNDAIIARGICWATTAAPTTSANKTSDGTGTGVFTSNLTGLTAGTTYYVRAYAINSAGTAYGNEISFTTVAVVLPTITTAAINSISMTSAVSGGNITADGGGPVTARGICWGTSTSPTLANSKTTDGTGTGSFTSNLTGLTSGTTYYVRAYATNNAGIAYGNELPFTTTSVQLPTLTTAAITSITTTSAASGGNVTADGGSPVTARGICWGTAASPTLANFKTTNGTGIGSFISNLTGLASGTTYYVRAYATNNAGTSFGNELSFTAASIQLPTLTTAAITSITLNSAVSGGNITADGGATVTARGVCWGITANPTVTGSKTTDGAGTGAFTSNITGLTSGTTYHVRAYSTNSAGTAYGNDLTFAAGTIQLPTVTTAAITSITLTSAVSGGNVTNDGGGAVTAKGVCWATTAGPTTAGSKTTDGTGTGAFTSNITGLTAGTTYFVRAYATNSAGTSYGNEISFVASMVSVPTLTTSVITSISQTSAVSGGSITSDGGGAVTTSGICWATTINPTISNFKTTDGTVTGTFASTLTGLTSGGTTYYVRAYATNSSGTAYGNQLSFNTDLGDLDGNSYNIVTIGTQVWMAENLKTTKYNDGTAIPNITDNTAWSTNTTGAYCNYSNTLANSDMYGKLYNWYLVASTNSKKVCPTGWHVPTDAEWTTLTTYLGGASVAGGKLKETTTTHWSSPNTGATNETGFTALPGGYRDVSGTFGLIGIYGFWWSSTISGTTYGLYRYMINSNGSISGGDNNQHAGSSVRCLKD
jgi:uncharacterized protein (TIGR02145 family)